MKIVRTTMSSCGDTGEQQLVIFLNTKSSRAAGIRARRLTETLNKARGNDAVKRKVKR